jgi:hypothetical protein
MNKLISAPARSGLRQRMIEDMKVGQAKPRRQAVMLTGPSN